MRNPLTALPWAITDTIKIIVSVKRIQKFLNAEELDTECIGKDIQCPSSNTIELHNATLTWNTDTRRNSISTETTDSNSTEIDSDTSIGIYI